MDKEMEDLNNSLPLILVSQKELDVLQAEIDSYQRTVKEEYAKREALEAEIDRLTHRLFQMNKALESMTSKYSDLLISKHKGE